MKRILLLLIALSLTACATINQPINTTRLAGIESSYGIALSAAVAYRNLRLCRRDEVATYENVCAYRSVIIQLQQADLKVQVALRAARQVVRDHPSSISVFSILQTAQTTVDQFRQIQVMNGIR